MTAGVAKLLGCNPAVDNDYIKYTGRMLIQHAASAVTMDDNS